MEKEERVVHKSSDPDWFENWPNVPDNLKSTQALKQNLISQQEIVVAKAYVEYLRSRNRLVVEQDKLEHLWR
jgi:hypothetical protein